MLMVVDKMKKKALENRLNKAGIKHYFVEDANMVMIPAQLEVTTHITEDDEVEHYLSDDLDEIDRFMVGKYDIYMECFGVDIGLGYIVEREDTSDWY